ncbi:MAG: porin family protein [Prevotella sp.]|nr:porin family protein [Prevotella sp.]
MKKVILASLAIAANLAIATPANAQVLKMGIKGGVNLCETKFSHGDVESKDKKGFFIGPTLKIAIPLLPLGFDIAALYDQREFKVCDSDMPVKLKQLAIPVNVRLTFGSSKSLAAFVFAGPQYSFNINDKETLKDNYHSWSYEDSNLSVNLGGGILISNFLQLSANYNIDCGKTGELTVDDTYQAAKKHSSKANAWQLAATIYF